MAGSVAQARGARSSQAFIWLSLISLYLIPPIGSADFAIRPIYGFYLCLPFLPGKSQMAHDLAWYGVFMLSMLYSIAWGWALLGVDVVLADVLEMIKLLLPLLAYLLGYFMFVCYREHFMRQLEILFVAVLVITLLQWGRVANGYFSVLYAAQSQMLALGPDLDYLRVVGVSGNPNDAGMLFFFFQLLFLSAYFTKKEPWVACAWLGAVLCLILTQSKTAYAALAFSVVLLSLLNRQFSFLLGAGVLAAVGAPLLLIDVVYVNNFVTAVRNDGLFAANVFSTRFDNAEHALETWSSSRLLGWGVAKSLHPSVVDVEYFLLLRRYGVLGALWLLLFALSRLFNAWRCMALSDGSVRLCAHFVLVGMLTVPIFMTSNNFFSAYYNQYFFFVILGALTSARQSARSA